MIERLKKIYENFKEQEKMTTQQLENLRRMVEEAKDSIQLVIEWFGPAWCGKATGNALQVFTNFKDRRKSWKVERVINVYEKLLKALRELDEAN